MWAAQIFVQVRATNSAVLWAEEHPAWFERGFGHRIDAYVAGSVEANGFHRHRDANCCGTIVGDGTRVRTKSSRKLWRGEARVERQTRVTLGFDEFVEYSSSKRTYPKFAVGRGGRSRGGGFVFVTILGRDVRIREKAFRTEKNAPWWLPLSIFSGVPEAGLDSEGHKNLIGIDVSSVVIKGTCVCIARGRGSGVVDKEMSRIRNQVVLSQDFETKISLLLW